MGGSAALQKVNILIDFDAIEVRTTCLPSSRSISEALVILPPPFLCIGLFLLNARHCGRVWEVFCVIKEAAIGADDGDNATVMRCI